MDRALLPDRTRNPARAVPVAVVVLVASLLAVPSNDAQAEPREDRAAIETPAEEKLAPIIRSKKEKCAELAELTGIHVFYCERIMKAMLVDLLLLSAKQDAQQTDRSPQVGR